MNTPLHTETQRIELASANAFFALYNARYSTAYYVTRIAGDGDVPDVYAKNALGSEFNLEITLTEDHDGEIRALLGRGDHLSPGSLKHHLASVRAGKVSLEARSLQHNALPTLLARIGKKLTKRYGPNTALVVRDTSPLWDWSQVVPAIQEHLSLTVVPFDRGIWLLSLDKSTLTQLFSAVRKDHR